MIVLRLWLFVSLSAGAPLNPKVDEKAIEQDWVKDDNASDEIVKSDDILDEGLHDHNSQNIDRDPKNAVHGGDISFSGEVTFSQMNNIKVASVILENMPIDGSWSDWSDYGACSATCGDATRKRTRTCSEPAPANGGKECSGSSHQTAPCNLPECVIDGGWTSFGECSKTCEGGVQQRTCTDPLPSPINVGKPCPGDYTQPCNVGVKCTVSTCTGPPPSTSFGSWSCDDDFTSCKLICTSGNDPTISRIDCVNGQWGSTSNHICPPSFSNKVYLLAGGKGAEKNVELYHPTLGSISPSCESPPPQLPEDWSSHTSFFHDSTIYLCGGDGHSSACLSFKTTTSTSWVTHPLPSPIGVGLSSVVLSDKVVFVGGRYSDSGDQYPDPTYATLPLSSSSLTLTSVPNLSYKGEGQCVAKLSESSFIISGGFYDGDFLSSVVLYNLKTEVVTSLAPLSPPRTSHGCIVVEQEGRKWLIVTGGNNGGSLATAQRLDIEANIWDVTMSSGTQTWEDLGDLKEARLDHTMVYSESRGVLVLTGQGGDTNELNSVELLVVNKVEEDIKKQVWLKTEPSLVTARSSFGGAMEVPADLFSCQLDFKQACNPAEEGSCNCEAETCTEDQICTASKCLDVCEVNDQEVLTADCFCNYGEGGHLCPAGEGRNICSKVGCMVDSGPILFLLMLG